MPKNKKKVKNIKPGLTTKTTQSDDESSEFNPDENASTISNASTSMSYQDVESTDDLSLKSKNIEDFVEIMDNIDVQVKTCIDNLLEKGFKEREDSLKLLKKIFSNKYIIDYLSTKRFTITEALLKCIKKGKTNEQILACDVMMLTLIQLAMLTSETLSILNESKQILLELIEDEKIEPEVRAECVKTLGLAIFITNENSTDTVSILDKLEAIYSSSYAKGDGAVRIHSPKVYELHTAALSNWCLLLCTLPLPFVNKQSQEHLLHFQDFLKSPDIDLRIVSGETIALLCEFAQLDSHSDLSCFEDKNLIQILTNLASDSSKYRSKKDKKQQRSSFRDILKTIQEGEFDSQNIKFGTESLLLDNWIKKKQYETFRDLLGTGMNIHLAENEFIRGLFDLGSPVQTSGSKKQNLTDLTSKQKAKFNKEQFRNRTKSMNKKRENKDFTKTQGEVDDDE